MGMINPTTGKYEPITRVITRDGRPSHHAEDVIAYQLADGTIVDFDKAQEYAKARNAIMTETTKARLALEEETRAKLGALYKSWVNTTPGAK
jgi:hypothetical protein